MKLNLGCGGKRIDGFVNVDIREEVKPDCVVDLMGPWPWRDGSVHEIQSYHVLEHLDKHDGHHFLSECLRVLERGGSLILEMPDVKKTAREFADGNDFRINNLYGLQRNPFDFHRYGYWPDSLSKKLGEMGFHVTHTGDGTDYHAAQEPCFRIEAVKL